MKHSKLTYHLLTILCLIATSCVTNGVMDDNSDNVKAPVVIEGGKVNLVLSFPTSSTRSYTGTTTDGPERERYINDVHIYTFVNDKFVEEAQYILIEGINGSATRIVEGKLSETYISGQEVEFVVIANTESKGIKKIIMNRNDGKSTLYRQLVYTYANNDWSENIPMWGVSTISGITTGTYNIGNLTLKRAIAKVNVTVNGGAGINNFRISKITLNNYNTQGYCAPIHNNGPSIPTSAVPSSNPLSSGNLEGEEGNKFENVFYIPEHKNTGVDESLKAYLKIQAMVNNVYKEYTLPFIENSAAYDILRNHVYIFNITSVKMGTDSSLEYEVIPWDSETVEIPPFN